MPPLTIDWSWWMSPKSIQPFRLRLPASIWHPYLCRAISKNSVSLIPKFSYKIGEPFIANNHQSPSLQWTFKITPRPLSNSRRPWTKLGSPYFAKYLPLILTLHCSLRNGPVMSFQLFWFNYRTTIHRSDHPGLFIASKKKQRGTGIFIFSSPNCNFPFPKSLSLRFSKNWLQWKPG